MAYTRHIVTADLHKRKYTRRYSKEQLAEWRALDLQYIREGKYNVKCCKHGHALSEENTYWIKLPGGARSQACRQCTKERVTRWNKRNPERTAEYKRKWEMAGKRKKRKLNIADL